ncbi:MAG: hypothetical protein HY681_15305 [Chloroflexi bacterium]|nr:hypothetical protein [Chloroflexota bacterium]
MANGRIDRRDLGFVAAEINGEQATVPCLFGQLGDPPLTGAVTLEIFLLAVDPVERRLVSVEGLLL